MPRLGPLAAAALAAALTLPAAASAAPGWTAPQPFPTSSTSVYAIDAAMSPGGDVAVAWSGDDRPARGMVTRESAIATKQPGGAFAIDRHAGWGDIVIDMDASGRVHRAYQDGPEIRLDGEVVATGYVESLLLDVSANGTAIVAWQTYDNTIRARIRPAGGTLGPVQTLATSSDEPQVAIADSGEAIAVWQNDASPWTMHYKVRPAGGAFPGSATPIGTPVTTPREPNLAMNARGDAQLVYVNNPGGGATQYGAAHRRAGEPFAETPAVSGPQAFYEAGVAAIAPNGDGLVAYRGDAARVVVRRGNTYDSTPDPLATSGQRLQATYDGRGNAYVAWIDRPGTLNVLRAARMTAGADGFDAPATIPTGEDEPMKLALAADAAGNAALAWHAFDGGTASVRVAGWDGAAPQIRSIAVTDPVAGLATAVRADVADVWSPVTATWAFGDGGSATGAAATHVFATPGATSATVTATDARGLSTTATRGLSVAPAPAPVITPPATTPAPAAPRAATPRGAALTASGLTLTRRDLRFRLSAKATVKVTIERCAARCARVRTLTVRGSAGANRVSLGRKRLPRGRYRVTIARRGQRTPLASKRLTVKR